MLRGTRTWLQHRTNPLHVYCRLMDLGLSAGDSRRLGLFYERHFHAALSEGLKAPWSLLKKAFWSWG